MDNGLRPTAEELRKEILKNVKHSCNVHYHWKEAGNLGQNDPELPHDLGGMYNKFSWEVLPGLAIAHRFENEKEYWKSPEFRRYVNPVIELHRQQHHHKQWRSADATDDDLIAEAFDILCAKGEKDHKGGTDNSNGAYYERNMKWIKICDREMRRIKPPNLEQIMSLSNIPNIGIPDEIHEMIVKRTDEAVGELRTKQGYGDIDRNT